MENENDTKIPLLEDIERPIEVSEDSIYPVKNHKKECYWKKKCKHGKCKKGRCIKKCLIFICKAALVLFLIFGVIASIAGYRWYRFVSQQVQQWTVTEPVTLPMEKGVPIEELQMVKSNAMQFWNGIQHGEVPEDFVLTQRDLNGFFAASDFLRGNAFAEIKNKEYQIKVSLPTDHLPGGKGRFFVATKTVAWYPDDHELKVKVEPIGGPNESMGIMMEALFKLTTMEEDERTLNLQLVSGSAFGHEIPQELIDEHYNLFEGLYNCDCHDQDCKQARKFVEGLAGITLEEGQVVVHADPEPKEATYYKNHEGHTWHHHDHHRHHHGKHGDHGHHHRQLRATIGGHHHHFKAVRMARRLLAY